MRFARWLKYMFVIGAVIDGGAAVMLLDRGLIGAFFGRAPHVADPDLALMMGYAASLMVGWTALLAWAAFDPVRRAFVGPLTAAPVLIGLAATEALAWSGGHLVLARVAPMMVLQLLGAVALCVLYGAVRHGTNGEPAASRGA